MEMVSKVGCYRPPKSQNHHQRQSCPRVEAVGKTRLQSPSCPLQRVSILKTESDWLVKGDQW